MEKNLGCPICKANAYHIDRIENGKYIVKCMKNIGQDHTRRFKLTEDTLQDLSNPF